MTALHDLVILLSAAGSSRAIIEVALGLLKSIHHPYLLPHSLFPTRLRKSIYVIFEAPSTKLVTLLAKTHKAAQASAMELFFISLALSRFVDDQQYRSQDTDLKLHCAAVSCDAKLFCRLELF